MDLVALRLQKNAEYVIALLNQAAHPERNSVDNVIHTEEWQILQEIFGAGVNPKNFVGNGFIFETQQRNDVFKKTAFVCISMLKDKPILTANAFNGIALRQIIRALLTSQVLNDGFKHDELWIYWIWQIRLLGQ